ncbi:MAG TPA: OmpA family protein [Devosia sp.]|nr:OmpA family protein [Sphingomonadaceae bacterium]HTO28628.1 OmpA family protein [Devosia sp.]
MRLSHTALLAAAAIALSGCATKGFVKESVSDLETRQNARMDQTDQRIDQIDKTSREALERAIAAGKLAEGKFAYDVVLSDDAVKFGSNRAVVSPAGQQRLSELASQLKAENTSTYLEIQGHTDSTGADSYNQKLGMERAEAVRLVLYKAGVPLNRMATISYGEEAPIAANNTAAGRAANRRVVIVVLK